MRNRKYVFMALFIMAAAGLGCAGKAETPVFSPVARPKDFVMAGSGCALPIAGKLAEGYFRSTGVRITVPASIGSDGGIHAVSDGAIELGLSSRKLSSQEIKRGLKQLPFARVGLVIGVNRDVPDTGITYQDLVEIMKGKKTQWSDGRPVVVLNRQAGESALRVLGASVPGFQEALADSYRNKRWQIYYTAAEEAQAIARTSGSIGFTDTGWLMAGGLDIKPLHINGREPTRENIENGQYRLFCDLYFIYKEPLAPRAHKFLAFVRSGEGQKIISANGGIPWKGK